MKTFVRMGAAAIALAACTSIAQAATQQNASSTAIVMQGFHWNSANYSNPNWYGRINAKAADLQDLGITHVWFPPPSDSAAREGYLPRQLNLLNSFYGSETDLRNAITALNGRGIKSIADVVVNHRVGTTDWADFTNPNWGCSAVVSNDEWAGHCGNSDSGTGFSAGRDIDHSQFFVRADIKSWISSKLKSVGFTGIRYDFSKGYAASYAKEYHDAWNPDFCVGEIWSNLNLNDVNPHRQELMNWIDATAGACATFDFTTKGLLNDALQNSTYWRLRDSAGKPQGAIGWWPQKQVTFVDNHDTGPSESCSSGQNLWPVPCAKVMQGYAYILTHPGIPSIYWPHVYDWNLRTAIKALISVRKSKGINSNASVVIQQAQTGLYAAIINNNVAMKIGPNSWSPGAGWTLATSGNDYAVWTR